MSTPRGARRGPAGASQRPRPIRVVPLHLPEAPPRAPVAAPRLTYRGGPVLGSVQVVSVFWGQAWTGDAQRATLTGMNDFLKFVTASAYVDQLAEYDTPSRKIGRGTVLGSVTITDASPGASVADAAIQLMLDRAVAAKTIPAPSADTLCFVLLPPGVAVVDGNDQSCRTFCGYHDRSGSGLYYAVVPSPDCSGCLGGLAPLDALTSVASHELAEAITDPVPGQGWYDDANGEIGDVCAWENKKLASFTVQLLWSNRAGACV